MIVPILVAIATVLTLLTILPWNTSTILNGFGVGLAYILADWSRILLALLTSLFLYILYIQIRYYNAAYIVDEAKTTFYIDDDQGKRARRVSEERLHALQPGVTAFARKVIPEGGMIPESSIECTLEDKESEAHTRSIRAGKGWEIIHDFAEPLPVSLFGFNKVTRHENLTALDAFPDCVPHGDMIRIQTGRLPHKKIVLSVHFPPTRGFPDYCSAYRVNQKAMNEIPVSKVEDSHGPGIRAQMKHSQGDELRLEWSFDT